MERGRVSKVVYFVLLFRNSSAVKQQRLIKCHAAICSDSTAAAWPQLVAAQSLAWSSSRSRLATDEHPAPAIAPLTGPTTPTNMTSILSPARQPAAAGFPLTPAESQKPPTAAPDALPTRPDAPPSPEAVVFRSRRRPRPTLTTLPPEIHLLIAQHLIYPDALSLKHVNRYFYQLVDTGVELKVEWLMERRLLHLECPSDQRCDLGSDLRFCRGSVKYVFLPPSV